ncbi:MAG: stage II sporulation protein P [Eubacteriales bacterium]|nr:stage II sporulation protein P [Eubacteriales bacterium]
MERHRRSHRQRGGIGRSAAIALCVAGSLLLCAHAGGEPLAQAALGRLARDGTFVARAMSLELGLMPEDATVFTPRTAAAARHEDVDEPPAESAYLPQAVPNDAPVLDAADRAATVTVNNDTSYAVDVAACLAADTTIRAQGEGPQVLLVHTHGSESYTPDAAFPYVPTENERTTDPRYNVVRVGDELQRVLEQGGVQTVHIRELFDSPAYSGSYDRALAAIEQALAAHPTIRLVIDLHRDSILTDSGEAYKTACTIDGAQVAQLMFVVGTDEGGLYHPNWRENLNYVAGLQYRLNRAYPGLMRPVNLRTQRFNQHASPGSLLVEVGSSGNTMTEALAAIRLFGAELARDLTGA